MSPRREKHLIIVAVILGVLAIICVLVVPRLVNVNRYRPEVAAYLETKTGKPAHIGHLELTLFPHLAIQIDDFAMGNPKGFPAGDFLQAQRIYALFKASALWNKRIVVKSLIVEKPVIHILSNADGHWNFENPPKRNTGTAKASDPEGTGFVLGEISKVTIDQGEVTLANLLPSGEMGPTYFNGQGISCSFQDVNVSALTASHSPAASSDPANSSPSQSGPIGVTSATDNPSAAVAHGSFHADSLLFGAILATSVDSQVRLFPKQAYLDNLTLKIAGGSAKGNVAFDFSQPNLLYRAQTAFQEIDVAQLLKAFPSARGQMTGTMEGNLNLNGEAAHSSDPLSGLQGTGQVNVRNGRLPSLQLNKNLLFLVRMAGIGAPSGDPASFSMVSADLNFVNQTLVSHTVRILSNDVDVNASGSVALTGSNRMNYTGIARVPAKNTGLTNVLAGLSGATYANGKLAFPFDLKGPLANPQFSLSSGKGILGGLPGLSAPSNAPTSGSKQGNQPGNFVQDLVNLFGKKKTSSTPPKQ